MILKLDQQDGIKIGAEGLQMGIDLSDPAKIFYILSQGFYSDPRRAIIQEVTSNIYDSTIASGKDIFEYPGYIVLTDQSITFKDFGEGISEERMEKIMSKFFATTKSKDISAIGTFGLGFKAIFSYSSQFTVVSTYENVKRTWLFSKDNSQIEIIKLSEQEVNEENQTSFIISIKDNAQYWYNKVIETIPYFKSIIFDCQVESSYYNHWNNSKKFNESQLIEGKTFYYRSYAPREFHICLDQVIYKINPSDLGIYLREFPFGLKFSVSEGITPLPNREQIMMNESTKALILNRLKECLEEIHEYYKEESLTLPEYFKDSNNLKFDISGLELTLNKKEINYICETLGVKSFIKFNPVFADIPNLSNKYYFFYDCLVSRGKIENHRINSNRWYDKSNPSKVILASNLTDAQKRFLRENYEYYYIGRIVEQELWGFHGFYNSLELKTIPREKWRPIIEEWIKEQKTWLSQVKEFPEQEYQDWLKNQIRNKPTRRKYESDEIRFNFLKKKIRGVGLRLAPRVLKGSEFMNNRIYVRFEELDLKASQYFELENYRVSPIIIDDKNWIKLKMVKGLTVLSPEQFEKTKYFKRLVFKKKINRLVGTTRNVLDNAFLTYNGILKEHLRETIRLKQNMPDFPDFLQEYKLDSKYKPIEDYLEQVSRKAQKLIIPEVRYYDTNVGKKLFVCQLKVKRLERELNKLKLKNG